MNLKAATVAERYSERASKARVCKWADEAKRRGAAAEAAKVSSLAAEIRTAAAQVQAATFAVLIAGVAVQTTGFQASTAVAQGVTAGWHVRTRALDEKVRDWTNAANEAGHQIREAQPRAAAAFASVWEWQEQAEKWEPAEKAESSARTFAHNGAIEINEKLAKRREEDARHQVKAANNHIIKLVRPTTLRDSGGGLFADTVCLLEHILTTFFRCEYTVSLPC